MKRDKITFEVKPYNDPLQPYILIVKHNGKSMWAPRCNSIADCLAVVADYLKVEEPQGNVTQITINL